MTAILSAIEQRLDQPTARGLAHAVSLAIRDGYLPTGTKLPGRRASVYVVPVAASLTWISHTYLVQSVQAPLSDQILADGPHAVGRFGGIGGPGRCGSRMASPAVLRLA